MLVCFFQNEYRQGNPISGPTTAPNNQNKVCVTGFSYGGAMAAMASALAARMGADGKRLACASYVGSASPVVLTDGILATSVDWKALQNKDNKNSSTAESFSMTQKRLTDELNKMQLTMLLKASSTSFKDNPVAVVKGMAMKHDAFITPRYALELQTQLSSVTSSCRPPHWEWLWGGHIAAALLRPIFHKKLVVDTVNELQKL